MQTRSALLAAALATTLGLAACGDDAANNTETPAPAGTNEAPPAGGGTNPQ